MGILLHLAALQSIMLDIVVIYKVEICDKYSGLEIKALE
jgi:hypothetical protein